MSAESLPSLLPESFWDVVRTEASALRGRPSGTRRASLGRLVDRFARAGREGRYLDDPSLFAAYLLAFLPYEIGKVDVPLSASARRVASLARRDALRIVDGGCGPGSASIGLLAWLARAGARPEVEVRLCDRVSAVRATARRLVAAAAGGLGIPVRIAEEPRLLPASGPADVVVLQNSLSEACRDAAQGAAQVAAALRLVEGAHAPGGCPGGHADSVVLLIEPADRERAWFLAAVRDAVLATGSGRVVAPCTHHGPCPMGAGSGRWCHVQVPLSLPRHARLGLREARLPRSHQKLSYLVLAPDRPVAEAADLYRLVGPPRRRHGFVEAPLCGTAGIVTARARSGSEAARRLARARWGECIAVSAARLAGDGLEVTEARLTVEAWPGDGVAPEPSDRQELE